MGKTYYVDIFSRQIISCNKLSAALERNFKTSSFLSSANWDYSCSMSDKDPSKNNCKGQKQFTLK